ncbi:hypothetical protein FRB90_006861, partial [Tulasnella sp. 427]
MSAFKSKLFRSFSKKSAQQESMGSEPETVFYGRGAEEADEFVRNVRKWGFANNQLGNPKAMADFASTCFTGPALRWYETLDGGTQRDWDALRKAILDQYPHMDKLESPPINESAFFPTPAAAAAPPLFVYNSTQSKSPNKLAGRLRFIAELQSSSGYISRMALSGLFEVTTDPLNALHVEIDTSGTLQPVNLLNSYPEKPYLGVTWYDGVPDWSSVSQKNATLCATTQDTRYRTAPGHYQGPTQISIWTYSGGELKPSWLCQDNGVQTLEAATFIAGKGVVFIPNYERFRSAGRSGYSKGRLVLEPL